MSCNGRVRESVKRNVKIGENVDESKTSTVKMETLISNWNILLSRACSITRRLNSLKLKSICKQLHETVRCQFVLQCGTVWTRWNYCVPLSNCNTTLSEVLNTNYGLLTVVQTQVMCYLKRVMDLNIPVQDSYIEHTTCCQISGRGQCSSAMHDLGHIGL